MLPTQSDGEPPCPFCNSTEDHDVCEPTDSAPPGQSTTPARAVDDPAWVLDKYREAKELLAEIRELDVLPQDLKDSADAFYHETFTDTCTTLGYDCACNR